MNTSRASASVASFVAGFFTDTTQAADTDGVPATRTISSQNVAILSAAINSDPVVATDSSTTDLTIVGDSALMSETGPLGTIANVDEFGAGADTISVYTVRDGDSLPKIAKMFGVSVNTIIWGNDLGGPKDIKVGQELIILPVSGIKYTIKKGDTIAGIARRYGGDVGEITKFNNLESGQKLTVGDEIIIPNGEISVSTPATVRGKPGPTRLIKTFIDEAIDSLAYYIRPIIHGHKTQGLHGKNAVDLAPDCHCVGHESILAAAAGQVIVARAGGWNGGYGNYVVISHPNGTQTVYGHMYSVVVHSGQTVDQGEKIGLVGSTGNSSGPHVHFEIRGARNPF
ncbi:MAG: M23 family metallopeptidase [Candidatus Vogelbacteria bacterium]|nr:M23 family metallopeptidase [Candidatus Vogelbacteria bacterium]